MAEPRREKTETQKNYTNYAGLKNWGWGKAFNPGKQKTRTTTLT